MIRHLQVSDRSRRSDEKQTAVIMPLCPCPPGVKQFTFKVSKKSPRDRASRGQILTNASDSRLFRRFRKLGVGLKPAFAQIDTFVLLLFVHTDPHDGLQSKPDSEAGQEDPAEYRDDADQLCEQ